MSSRASAATPFLNKLRADCFSATKAVLNTLMPSRQIHFDTDEVDYSAAAQLAHLATDSIFVPIDTHCVTVFPDTRENRAGRQHQVEQTLYLPGLTSQEMTDVATFARVLFDVRQASAQPAQGTVTLVGPLSRLQVLDATVAEIWRGNAQIAVDLRLSEVQRSVSRNVRLKLPPSSTAFNVDNEVNNLITANSSAVSAIVSSGPASANDTVAIAAILIEEGYGTGILTDPFAVFGNGLTLTGVTFGTLTAELSLSSTDSRSLNRSETVVREGETAQLKAGSRYPLKVSEYNVTNYSTSGRASTSTTPQMECEDLGFTAKVTPFLQENNRIKIKSDLNIEGWRAMQSVAFPCSRAEK
jgi:general secretion pathway protein D